MAMLIAVAKDHTTLEKVTIEVNVKLLYGNMKISNTVQLLYKFGN